MKRYPKKIELVLKLLIEQGYFNRERDIVNIALLEYFKDNGFFEAVSKKEKTN